MFRYLGVTLMDRNIRNVSCALRCRAVQPRHAGSQPVLLDKHHTISPVLAILRISAALPTTQVMVELAAASGSTPSTRKSRGANPSADYKSLFLKSKDKYDRVSTEQTELKVNVTKAAAKQQKLREELDYLLDVIATKQEQRAHIEEAHRSRALELEREAAAAVAAAAAARHHASSLSKREREKERDSYEHRAAHREYEGGDEYRPYSARYTEPTEPGYPAFGSGMNRRYASPPLSASMAVEAEGVVPQRGGDRYPPSEGSSRRTRSRDPLESGAYRQALPSQSPPSSRKQHAHETHPSPSRYEAQQRYRESSPSLPTAAPVPAAKRPRPSSVERELLETDDAYDIDSRDRYQHSKRARND